MLDQLITTFSQPSTYNGLSGIALAFGLSNQQWMAVSAVAAAVFGLLGVIINEKGAPVPNLPTTPKE